ncbi:MAG: 3-dehydroquinate synthase [Armatimonadetes bacterium]|nr:3-dehydroquinate synthase [Armatimonadota bacterium]
MQRVAVPLPGAEYEVTIGRGLIDRLGSLCRAAGVSDPIALVVDGGLPAGWPRCAQAALEAAGYRVAVLAVPPGEASKSLAGLERLYRSFAAIPLDRGATVAALGGGMVGDLAGFAAATYLRGLAFVQIPTTLLAQVDASIGGKTAIDLPEGKNLVGAFHQPRLVVCDLDALADLPEEDFRAGLAEIVKNGVIADAELFAYLEGATGEILARAPAALERIVVRSCQIKADVVARDERESGWRAILNFGHTIGHAIEAVAGYGRYRHGEAVAIGMVGAAFLSERGNDWRRAETERLEALLHGLRLPTRLDPPLPEERLLEAARLDKKARGGEVRFVLARRFGEVEVTPVSEARVRAAVRALGAVPSDEDRSR